MFHGASNLVFTGGNFNVKPEGPPSPIQKILQTLEDIYVPCATHDTNDILDAPKCHPGTRTSFLRRLSRWVKDAESSVHVTWLNGPAGAGKSAIARSLAEILDGEGLLAGSFFFFRTDSRRNSEKPLVATIAYQVAHSIPGALPHIVKAVEDDPMICSRSLRTQFKKLIADPIVHVSTSESFPPKLVLIDGLDECTDHMARSLILNTIFENLPRLRASIKFLIVSRSEYDIQRTFESAPASLGQHIDTLELLGDLQAFEDVRVYLRDNFHRIKQTHPLKEYFTPDWPSDHAIERLVEKSSGHFIYASTVTKYIENDLDQPQKCLDIIVNLRPTSRNPYAELDALYLNILFSSRIDHALLVNILSTVILVDRLETKLDFPQDTRSHMKSYRFVASVLLTEPGELELALLDLKSLVQVKGVIVFWHKSFSDFLLDSSRSGEFYASLAYASTLVAKGCLRLLSDKTGLLERLWFGLVFANPRRRCHHLLSLCCENAVPDHHLQTAMMSYEFNVIPPDLDSSSGYFGILCCCLRNYQRTSAFKGTKVIKHILRQFDKILITELRRWVPLDSRIMDALRAAISPRYIDWNTFRAGVITQSVRGQCPSCFLEYMYFEWTPDADGIICDFFHSKGRACEYYLGKHAAHLMKPLLTRKLNTNASSTPLPPVSSRSAATTKHVRAASIKNAPSTPPASKVKLRSSRKRMKTNGSTSTSSTDVAELKRPAKSVWLSGSTAVPSSASTQTTPLHQTPVLIQVQQPALVPPRQMESLTGRQPTFLAPEGLPLSRKVITISTAQPLAPRLVIIPPGVSAVISMEDLFAEEEREEEDWELVSTSTPDIQHIHPQGKKPSSMTLSVRTRFSVHLQRLRAKKST